jgi:GAF domain-containing protein
MKSISLSSQEKRARYEELIPQLESLVHDEPDLVANLANLAAALYEALAAASWVGFYRRVGDELVLGPFQGKVACVRIPWGKGVCGTAAARAQTVVVDDVEAFPGHIACDAATKSEIVVPIRVGARVVAVLDVDSHEPAAFDAVDERALARVAELASQLAW